MSSQSLCYMHSTHTQYSLSGDYNSVLVAAFNHLLAIYIFSCTFAECQFHFSSLWHFRTCDWCTLWEGMKWERVIHF